MAHFDSLAANAPFEHNFELISMVRFLGSGAPVGSARIRLNGATATYSIVARYDVFDHSGTPEDSTVVALAWRGADADTIILFEFPRVGFIAQLTTPAGLVLGEVNPSSGAATVSAQRGACTSFRSALPPDASEPQPIACNAVTVSASATGVLSNGAQSVTFALPQLAIAAVRYEFDDSAP